MPGMRKVASIALLLVLTLPLVGASPADRFDDLGHRLMCACGCRQILLECNHVGCSYSSRMRDELQIAMTSGDSDDLILQGFVQKYGATVLAAPTTTGFNLWAWIMPFAVFAAAVSVAAWIIHHWRLRLAAAPIAASGADSPRLEAFRRRAREETDL